jgi:hypothetical protein
MTLIRGFRALALAFWLACVLVIVTGEARGSKSERADVHVQKPFETFRLPTPKPAYPALSQ